MPEESTPTEAEITASIAEATGFDSARAAFMLGLHRGDTSGDVVVVGGTHTDPPAVELSSTATVVRTETGALVIVPSGHEQIEWSSESLTLVG